MSDNQTRVVINGDASQANREMEGWAAKVQAAVASVKASLGSISTGTSALHGQVRSDLEKVEGAIGMVSKRFAAWAALVAGGAVLKSSIDASVTFTKEANALSKALGINTQEAATLNVALGDVYITADTMTGAASKLARQLRTNEEGLNAMGLRTRDADGNLRNMRDLMMDVIKVVNGYREGTDRTMAAQVAFGKGADEVTGLLKLNAEVIEEARKKQEALGLVVGVDNVEAAKRYRAVMNDVGDVLLAVKKAIGDAVMPMFTRLGEWFTSIGPAAVVVIRGAIGGLVSVFWGLKNAVVIAWQVLDSFVFTIAEPLRALAEALYKLFTGDFKGATEAMMSWPDQVAARWKGAWATIVESSEDTRDKLAQLFLPSAPAANGGGDKGKNFKSDGGKTDDRMQRWEAELARQKAAFEQMNAEQGTFYQYGKEREAAYWQAILATLDAGDKQRWAVQKRYYGLLLDLRKQNFEAEQAELQTRIEAAKGNFDEQEMLAELYADRARQRYGADSKEYQAALQKLQQLYRQHRDALREIDNIGRQRSRDDQLEDIAAMERAAQLERDLGLITQQRLLQIRGAAIELRRQIEEQAKLAEIEAMKGNPNADPVALAKLEAELAAIRRKYRAEKGNNQDQQTVESHKPFEAIFGASQQAIQQGMDSMIQRMRLSWEGLRGVIRSIGTTIMQELITKPASEWLVRQARMVVETVFFGQQRVAAEAATAGEISAIQGALSLRNIAASAAEAAANAYKSIAAIPVVGPFAAPAAAAAALAAVMALGRRVFSAEGGFDVPAGVNPMTQLHQREMVLPARHADVIRDLADMRTSLVQGTQAPVQLPQGISARDFYITTSRDLIAAVKLAQRNRQI